jgi:hypothetical protein
VADLATLKTRVAFELNRTDLTSAIADAINSAIKFYRSSRFEVNEQQATFNTVAGQESYTTATIPDDIGQIDTLRATINGRLMVLEPWTFEYLQNISTTQNTEGQPWGWAWYAQKIFFYPVPDSVYTILVSYQQRKDAPANDSDSSTIWTNDLEPIIRARAKKLVARDVMYDDELAARCTMAEAEELRMLKLESLHLQDEGGLVPNW